MGYFKELEDYTEYELSKELQRRAEARAAGKCDYCGYPRGKSIRAHLKEIGQPYENASDTCKFNDRHHAKPVQTPPVAKCVREVKRALLRLDVFRDLAIVKGNNQMMEDAGLLADVAVAVTMTHLRGDGGA